MDDLTMDLGRMCRHNRDGAYGTQKNRLRGLTAMAADLRRLGYRLPGARSLKTRHVNALVEHWQGNDLDDATIRNRLSWLRWWADRINKPNIVERDNATYGLAKETEAPINRARKLDPAKFKQIACPLIRASVLLQVAFGLRREEAIKFQPAYAIQAHRIVLKSSWTKGGRARSVPIIAEAQRRVLMDIRRLIPGHGSLIPTNSTYAEQLRRYEYQTLQAGLRNTHGFRHAYAQQRYLALTGQACPLQGGKRRGDMSEDERQQDRAARLKISGELGHARLAITDTYLGRA
ncbi:phage integrase N-terminal domain-containing protein [Nitratireductor sp. StC3]|uniref:phage integrase N-terminal domain-containing protein n=1 Tax=Nitratireductor sp. StC3 TaxID=2126741 RepID=UPI000D0CF7CE|nr:phage integrase N-terminal domain-containing protein [Nitratireductor sp. StC3]PSM19860.1 integrase [Nitratireductor sp. StC3]